MACGSGPLPTISFSVVEGGAPDQCLDAGHNTSQGPCFAEPGGWDGATWVCGDYHLQSPAGRWDPATQHWVTTDARTSDGIDAGDPASPVGHEPAPNGGRVNLGAYGGTTEASKSFVEAPGLAFDMAIMAGGRLNLTGPGAKSLTLESLNTKRNPSLARYAIHVGPSPAAGWLRFVDAGGRTDVYADGTDPEWHPATAWAGKRLRGLLPDTAHELQAMAENLGGFQCTPAAAGAAATNRDCDVNRSGLATALDYALVRVACIRGGQPGLDCSHACDVNDDGSVDTADLDQVLVKILHP